MHCIDTDSTSHHITTAEGQTRQHWFERGQHCSDIEDYLHHITTATSSVIYFPMSPRKQAATIELVPNAILT